MASPVFAARRHIGLLVNGPTSADPAGLDEAAICATIASLERLGLRPRVYALTALKVRAAGDDPAAQNSIGTARRRVMRSWVRALPHVHGLAISPIRYINALGHAALRSRAALGDFVDAVHLAGTLRRDGVVHLHACDPVSSSVAEAVARLTGLRFSMSLPSTSLDRANSHALKRSLTAASFTLMPTDAALQAAKAIAPSAAVHRAYPGVDYRRYSPKLRSRGTSVPLILARGEPRAPWELGTLIDACRELLASGLKLRCEVVGAARELLRMQAQIDRCGLHDCIRLVGPLSENQLLERYARAAVFVQVPGVSMPASSSGIPAGLLEAMAMGLPVVATRTPATEECVTHASNGWLVATGDAAQLCRALQDLLVQPRLGEGLGRQARETVVERFDNDVNLRTLQELLDAASQRTGLLPGRESPSLGVQRARRTELPRAPFANGHRAHELHHA